MRATARLALADIRSASLLETVTRVLLVRAGLEPDELNTAIRGQDDVVVAEGDLVWRRNRVVLFCDGMARHSRKRSVIADRTRTKALEAAGWIVVRVTWDDVHERPEWVVREVAAALGVRGAA